MAASTVLEILDYINLEGWTCSRRTKYAKSLQWTMCNHVVYLIK